MVAPVSELRRLLGPGPEASYGVFWLPFLGPFAMPRMARSGGPEGQRDTHDTHVQGLSRASWTLHGARAASPLFRTESARLHPPRILTVKVCVAILPPPRVAEDKQCIYWFAISCCNCSQLHLTHHCNERSPTDVPNPKTTL